MMTLSSVSALTDSELLNQATMLAVRERQATADLIATLAELDVRRLYLGAGCSSLFTYCTEVLHLSEHAAYGRIEAARAARRFPTILTQLADGSLTLTAVCLLASVLTEDNVLELLDAARHKTKRDVEQLVARVRPQPAVASSVRKLPTAKPRRLDVESIEPAAALRQPTDTTHPVATERVLPPPATTPAVERPPIIAPLAPERYRVQFTFSRDAHDKLRRAQDLLRHSIPNGDPAVIFEQALTLLVADLEKRRLAAARTSACGRSVISRLSTRASVSQARSVGSG